MRNIKMPKVKMWVSLSLQGCKVETVFEAHEDDCSETDLAEYARDWIWENIDYGWEVDGSEED